MARVLKYIDLDFDTKSPNQGQALNKKLEPPELAMIEKTLKRITKQLELFAKSGISLMRALDLMEASTNDLEEIICLNTLRETLGEAGKTEMRQGPQGHLAITTGHHMPWMGMA
ncbi:MAG: hypothetical protein A2508_09135 [Candidatus Lambdaproteobacteria bacterium RIFOXYD12_FULL_49_8]|nr:MAG: hypothetical protein A2508_09135 [Candidatus Lambdaproteobacteria bacterium RIFOXYD12_FULL_49_8]